MDDFSRRYRHEIDLLHRFLCSARGDIDRGKIAIELKRYIDEYGIDTKTACEAIARKWGTYHDVSDQHRRFDWDPGDPPPSFALDALEADIFTSLLTRARHKTVAKYMREWGYDEATVKSHMPKFIRKWEEIRSIEWASLMIMKPLDAEEA